MEALMPLVSRHSLISISDKQIQKTCQSLSVCIEKVDIQRVFPHTLHMTLHMHHPRVSWNQTWMADLHKKKWIPLDRSMNLVALQGPDHRRDEVLNRYQTMTQDLLQHGIDLAIISITLEDCACWIIRLNASPGQLILSDEHIEKEWACFLKWLPVLKKIHQPIESMDMRYPQGCAVCVAHDPSPS